MSEEKVPGVYVTELELHRIKFFADPVRVDFRDATGQWARWSVIIGENGVGKTTVLRAIAGLLQPLDQGSPPAKHKQLFDFFLDESVRSPTNLSEARILSNRFPEYSNPHRLFQSIPEDETVHEPKDLADREICIGYGASRKMGSTDQSENRLADASATLFDDEALLANAEELIIRIDYSAEKDKTEELKNAFDAGETDFNFDTSIYGHASVKEELKRVQSGKCCFCESLVNDTAYGDVEHFRPQKAYLAPDGTAARPGYYWLAYAYENLFFSCQICNQKYKRNHFPLADENQRARSHHDDLEAEAPLLLDPGRDHPADFLRYNRSVVVAIDENPRGEATIAHTGRNRIPLEERRRQYRQKMALIAQIAHLPGPHQAAARQMLRRNCRRSAPYALMMQNNFPNFVPE
ncbi:MAG: ATP-binding cassette domain-containing protein [Bacteroidota bacterium]